MPKISCNQRDEFADSEVAVALMVAASDIFMSPIIVLCDCLWQVGSAARLRLVYGHRASKRIV
jgi:hypothetical protein